MSRLDKLKAIDKLENLVSCTINSIEAEIAMVKRYNKEISHIKDVLIDGLMDANVDLQHDLKMAEDAYERATNE